jgi:hypothetical protein
MYSAFLRHPTRADLLYEGNRRKVPAAVGTASRSPRPTRSATWKAGVSTVFFPRLFSTVRSSSSRYLPRRTAERRRVPSVQRPSPFFDHHILSAQILGFTWGVVSPRSTTGRLHQRTSAGRAPTWTFAPRREGLSSPAAETRRPDPARGRRTSRPAAVKKSVLEATSSSNHHATVSPPSPPPPSPSWARGS